ncbi:sigma 54-interacting transcriptional regulator [Stenotrophomonas sp. UBA7606]|uniref:sigma 54-interacting transcriptional regulator n=1 Tax=Stenotrophomonas sp. UBA7606 TaxID=1947559 RepID=UPI0039C9CCD7
MMPDPTTATVWVVDDDRSVRFVLTTALREAGYTVEGFEHAAAALAALETRPVPDLLFTDVRMPGDNGLALLEKLKAAHPQLPVIVMSAYTDVASTAGAFRGGAHEFLSKPFDLDDAVELARRALPEPLVEDPPAAPPPAAVAGQGAPQLIGDTPAMRALFRAIGKLAQAPLSVLINGETGTGKELVANALHRESPRAKGPFVALNTAAIPAELLESELFGHEAGAFTGAHKRHIGRFEQADGGTLFLDEVGELPLASQAKLLRVLQSGQLQRVGSDREHQVDVRVIAATNLDLADAVRQGRFRADLYHRLGAYPLRVPPLRERERDVLLLAGFFIEEARSRMGLRSLRLSADAQAALLGYDWPGNVRELEHLIGRAVLRALAASGTVRPRILTVDAAALELPVHSDASVQAPAGAGQALQAEDLRKAVDDFQRQRIAATLERTAGNWTESARLLGLDRANLNRLAKRLGLK